jgi:hypothetical protein
LADRIIAAASAADMASGAAAAPTLLEAGVCLVLLIAMSEPPGR